MKVLKLTKTWIVWLFLLGGLQAQGWGPMRFIDFDEYPPISSPGIFNPSYCDNDSMLYFDGFFRYGYIYPDIWNAQFDGFICHNAMALPYPINLPEQPEIINAMPSISKSGDTLFFCSNRTGTYGGLDIWMSIKDDTTWGEPINLGDSINTELYEFSPYYAAGISTLFFDRLEQQVNFHFGLYSSIYLGDGIWQGAQRMPVIINPIDHGNCSPYFHEDDNMLYFNRFGNIYRSEYIDNVWTEPQILNDNVNGLWIPNIYNRVATRRPWISNDGNFLFFSKDIWEYNCIDFTSFLFFSENTVGIDDLKNMPSDLSLDINIYPNPSNAQTTISYSLPTPTGVKIEIYDLLGRKIETIATGIQPAGHHQIIWDAGNRPSGVYFYKLQAGDYEETKKMVFMK